MSAEKPSTPPYFGIKAMTGLVLASRNYIEPFSDSLRDPAIGLLEHLLPEGAVEDLTVPFYVKAQLAVAFLSAQGHNFDINFIEENLRNVWSSSAKNSSADVVEADYVNALRVAAAEQLTVYAHSVVHVTKLSSSSYERLLQRFRKEEQPSHGMAHAAFSQEHFVPRIAPITMEERAKAAKAITSIASAMDINTSAGRVRKIKDKYRLRISLSETYGETLQQALANMDIRSDSYEIHKHGSPAQESAGPIRKGHTVFLIDIDRIVTDAPLFANISKISGSIKKGSGMSM